ncbi:MAG: hypothetical protein ABEJ65_11440, partial [bacterium]
AETRSSDVEWTRDRARGFLTTLLLLIRHRYLQPERDIFQQHPSLREQISYRLVPEILDRLNELEQGGQASLVINSLLEELYFPEETTEWARAM